MNPLSFHDQIAVVTGAAHGLGHAIVGLLAARGATTVIADIDSGAAEIAAARLPGDRALALTVDVTDTAALERFRDEVLRRVGTPQILVNNAGAYPQQGIREISAADFDRVIAVNLKSVFFTSRAFMEPMVRAGYGRIVNIASIDAYTAKINMAHYAAAKAGVVSLTKTFAAELAPHGVLVNGVSPGPIATEKAKSQDWLAKRIPQIPVGYAAEPVDIAEIVLFLASHQNRFISGETIIASGAMVMV